MPNLNPSVFLMEHILEQQLRSYRQDCHMHRTLALETQTNLSMLAYTETCSHVEGHKQCNVPSSRKSSDDDDAAVADLFIYRANYFIIAVHYFFCKICEAFALTFLVFYTCINL